MEAIQIVYLPSKILSTFEKCLVCLPSDRPKRFIGNAHELYVWKMCIRIPFRKFALILPSAMHYSSCVAIFLKTFTKILRIHHFVNWVKFNDWLNHSFVDEKKPWYSSTGLGAKLQKKKHKVENWRNSLISQLILIQSANADEIQVCVSNIKCLEYFKTWCSAHISNRYIYEYHFQRFEILTQIFDQLANVSSFFRTRFHVAYLKNVNIKLRWMLLLLSLLENVCVCVYHVFVCVILHEHFLARKLPFAFRVRMRVSNLRFIWNDFARWPPTIRCMHKYYQMAVMPVHELVSISFTTFYIRNVMFQ